LSGPVGSHASRSSGSACPGLSEGKDLGGAVLPGDIRNVQCIAHPLARNLAVLLLPKTSSMLVRADVWVWPMLCVMAAGGVLVLPGNAVAW
jgi:hypothetical protein